MIARVTARVRRSMQKQASAFFKNARRRAVSRRAAASFKTLLLNYAVYKKSHVMYNCTIVCNYGRFEIKGDTNDGRYKG